MNMYVVCNDQSSRVLSFFYPHRGFPRAPNVQSLLGQQSSYESRVKKQKVVGK